jgi:hypothetical protein
MEDSDGSAETIFLEGGFLDYLNKVYTGATLAI